MSWPFRQVCFIYLGGKGQGAAGLVEAGPAEKLGFPRETAMDSVCRVQGGYCQVGFGRGSRQTSLGSPGHRKQDQVARNACPC